MSMLVGVRIHPYADADAVGLAGLWDGEVPSLGSGSHGADRAAPRWKRTLVAQEGDRLVGVATVGQNWAHPGWYSAAVDVAPGHRRQGIGRAMLAALRGLPPAPKPLLGKIWADDPASTGFLAAAGGTVVQRCPPMTVPLRHPDVREWAATRTLPDATTVRTGAELTTAQLTRLWTDVYCWVHQPWAPTDTRSAMDSGFATITDSMDLPATRI